MPAPWTPLPGSPHRAFKPGPVQWNFIEAPHRPHSPSCHPRFCTIFGRRHPVNLAKLFSRKKTRERLFRVIRWRCGWLDAGRGAPSNRGRYGRKGNGLDVTHRPVKRSNYASGKPVDTKILNAINLIEPANLETRPAISTCVQICNFQYSSNIAICVNVITILQPTNRKSYKSIFLIHLVD